MGDMKDNDILATAQKRFKDAKKHLGDWHNDAREDFAFVAGEQWDKNDIAYMEEQGRQAVTFNHIAPTVDVVVGAETAERQEVRYLPVGIEDTGMSDALSKIGKYFRDKADVGTEESDAFRDAVICGMGWTETSMDYESDPEGRLVIDRRDPLRMVFDPSASKMSLSDRKWQMYEDWVDKDDLKALWPDKADLIAPSGESLWADEDTSEHDASKAWMYEKDATGYDKRTGQFRRLQYQWKERKPVYRVGDPSSGRVLEFSEAKFQKLKIELDARGIKYLKVNKWVYYRAWIVGDTVMEQGELECGAFTFNAITGRRDRNEHKWYGIVRAMKDPQRWANKWLSQMLYILNTNAKGGIMAEKGAFLNSRKAEDDWAKADSIIWMKDGAISGNKVEPKPQGAYPQGFQQLMMFAVDAIRDVSGINKEILGLTDRKQPGILEDTRKKSAMTILAPIFDSLRLYRKISGRLMMKFIRLYMADGRLVRIAGDEAQYVPLTKDKIAEKYDVVVDEVPMSQNQKERVFNTLAQIVPQLVQAGIAVPPDILDYSPLPATVVKKWKDHIAEQSQAPNMEEITQKMTEMGLKLKEMEIRLRDNREREKTHLTDERERTKMELEFMKDIPGALV